MNAVLENHLKESRELNLVLSQKIKMLDNLVAKYSLNEEMEKIVNELKTENYNKLSQVLLLKESLNLSNKKCDRLKKENKELINRIKEIKEEKNCPVCYTESLQCGHYVCSSCMAELYKQGHFRCPTCRAEIDENILKEHYDLNHRRIFNVDL